MKPLTLREIRLLRTFYFGKRAILKCLVHVYDISPKNTFPDIYSCLSKVTLSNIREGLVKMTFPLP